MHTRTRGRLLAILLIVTSTIGLTSCESAVARQQHSAQLSVRDGAAAPSGGTLRYGISEDLSPKTFLQIGSGINGDVIANVFDTLIRYSRDGLTVNPSLATAWTPSPDGLSLALDLRPDVKFHDGRPFVSSDVEKSIKAYLDGPWTPQFRRTAAAITRFDTTDPHRVVLFFAHPLSNVFDLLDSAPILDANTLPALKEGKTFNGTGPFTFTQWRPKDHVRLERNAAYWGGAPHLDAVEYTYVSDVQALNTRLRTGQIDLARGLTYHDQQLAVQRNGFQDITLVGAESQQYVGVNVKNPALADVRLRQAIAYSIDRDRIVGDVLRGSGYPVNLPWPKWSPAYDASRNATYKRDVAKARALVQQIGSVPEITLDYPATGGYRTIAEIVQSNLADAGIRVRLVANELAQQSEKLIGGKFEGLWLLEHGFAQFTPSTLAVSAYPFNATKNSSNYSDPDYTRASETAWLTPDGSSPAALGAYRTLSDHILNDLFLIEIGVVFRKLAVAPGVGNIDWGKRNELRFAKAFVGAPQ